MTKLLTHYNETFSDGVGYVNAIWQVAKQDSSINGLYLCLSDYLHEGYLGASPSTNTLTWYNMLADGNYLIGNDLTRVANSNQFNNKPCITFNDAGTSKLRYRYPVNVGTIVMVYLVRQAGSYIIYAPRTTPPPNPTFYDAFPPAGNSLWANEGLTGGSVYNATSRINGKVVPPSTFIPLNSTRILSVKNIANSSHTESISGYGGQYGVLGGGDYQGGNNSLKGSLAAIITYENSISDELLSELELKLAEYYIQYDGVVQTNTPTFKYLVGSTFSFDFSGVFVDEWFDITNYEVISPNTMGLTFSGSTLTGTLNTLYDDKLTIAVTNSANMTKQFQFDLLVCRQDPIVNSLPALSNLRMVLSGNKNIDGGYYGLKLNTSNEVVYWEDARRVHNTIPIVKYNQVDTKPCQYIENTALLNNQGSVQFTDISQLQGSSISAKTFAWVYSQNSYGNRNMLNTFPDIKGTGVLWTVSNSGETHGNTPVTKLVTKVQRVPINTLNFKVPLNTPYIVTATVPDNSAIDFSALQSMRGNLAFFAAWDTVLNESQLNTVVSVLATRYYSNLAPYIFDTKTEYRNTLNVSVDLTKKVTELRNQPLTYNLLTPIYDAAIDTNGLLTFTAVKDELLTFSIEVTNTDSLTSTLTFNVDIVVRPNPLYLNLKSVLGTDIDNLFITDTDTLVLDGLNINQWKDYRLNGYVANGNNVELVSLPQLNNYYAADFDISGQSYLGLPVAASGQCFGITYVRKENALSRAFLMGQTSTAEFISGINGRLWDSTTSPKILNSTTYVNGVSVEDTYTFSPQVVNTVFINTTDILTVNSIAQDRLFTDRSVKGYIPMWFVLDRNISSDEAQLCNKYIRDYYDPVRFITLLHFDSGVTDSSVENKVIASNASIDTSIKKFGTGSLHLVNNSTVKYVEIPNDIDYAHLLEDYTVSMWMYLTKVLDTNDILSIYNQTDLLLYIKENKLYVGRSYTSDLALLSYTIPNNLLSLYNHIAMVRYNKTLTLYVNGVSVGSVLDDKEYRDYSSVVRLGQRTGIITANVNVYLDEVAVYKRGALYTGNSFTVPAAPYTI